MGHPRRRGVQRCLHDLLLVGRGDLALAPGASRVKVAGPPDANRRRPSRTVSGLVSSR